MSKDKVESYLQEIFKKHFEEIYQEKLYHPEKVDNQIWKHIFWEMFENEKKGVDKD